MKHSSYREFFENLARNHTALNHTETTPRFFAWDKDFLREKQNSLVYPILMLSPLGGNIRDNGAGHVKDIKSGGFAVLISEKRAGGDPASREEIYDTAFSIGLDILAKMKELAKAGNCAGLGFDLNRVSYELLDYPWLDNCYGYAFMLPLSQVLSLTVNPLAWRS
jgi:hypothetical protein